MKYYQTEARKPSRTLCLPQVSILRESPDSDWLQFMIGGVCVPVFGGGM